MAVLAASLALAGCGGDDDKGPAAPREPTSVGVDSQTTPVVPPESAEGGAGDEQPIQVPARFSVSRGQVTPGTITVPPRIPVALEITSADGKPHEFLLRTPVAATLAVPAEGAATQVLGGLPAGLYLVKVDGSASNGALAVGGDAGP